MCWYRSATASAQLHYASSPNEKNYLNESQGVERERERDGGGGTNMKGWDGDFQLSMKLLTDIYYH